MGERLRYVKRPTRSVVAVRLALETDGFAYRKWGDVQRCKAGDWLVDNDGDVYTVDAETFARTYREVRPGQGTVPCRGHFVKTTPIWAEVATEDGTVTTKEGATHYEAGDYLVFNEPDGGDPYAVSARKFQEMYERDE